MAGSGHGGGVVGSGKGLEVVEGVVGVEEALSLPSPWAETSREGGSTEAGGSAAWLGRGLEAAVEVVRMLGDEVAYL